jgi:hypothetical protein
MPPASIRLPIRNGEIYESISDRDSEAEVYEKPSAPGLLRFAYLNAPMLAAHSFLLWQAGDIFLWLPGVGRLLNQSSMKPGRQPSLTIISSDDARSFPGAVLLCS